MKRKRPPRSVHTRQSFRSCCSTLFALGAGHSDPSILQNRTLTLDFVSTTAYWQRTGEGEVGDLGRARAVTAAGWPAGLATFTAENTVSTQAPAGLLGGMKFRRGLD